MAQLMHLQFPLGDGHHLLPPLLPPHALAADELLDDCTLFGSLAGSLLPTPLQPLPAGAPGLPAPGALPLPLSVDDIFEGLDVEDDVFDFDPADTTPGAAFVDHAVWAKLRSYPAWPAQVLSPHVGHQAPPRPRPSCVLVHFFGTYDIQWVESEKKISPFERDFQLYANKDKSKAFQRAVKEAQHFIATGGPRLGQLPPAMMPDDSADGVMYHPTHSLPAEGTAKSRKRGAGDRPAGGTAWRGGGSAPSGPLPPLKPAPPPADGIPRRLKVSRRLGLLPPAASVGTDA